MLRRNIGNNKCFFMYFLGGQKNTVIFKAKIFSAPPPPGQNRPFFLGGVDRIYGFTAQRIYCCFFKKKKYFFEEKKIYIFVLINFFIKLVLIFFFRKWLFAIFNSKTSIDTLMNSERAFKGCSPGNYFTNKSFINVKY